MIQVTMREWTVLTFIRNFRREHGFSPSKRDIMAGCELSSEGAQTVCVRLKAFGLIRMRDGSRGRTIVPCDVAVGVTP